jgi:NTE family protein
MRTGTAFRFGSRASSSWRYGTIVDNDVSVAEAVAASAAYPALLPALHRTYEFESRRDVIESRRVVLTDGGVWDNLGTSIFDHSRTYTEHRYPGCRRVISCQAARGEMGGEQLPYGWPARMVQTVHIALKKLEDGLRGQLFEQKGDSLDAVVTPYLGQKDGALEHQGIQLPEDFVEREEVIYYPTDFAAMPRGDLDRLTRRGEQLTELLIGKYWPK